MKLISVIIPTYNLEAYIEGCLASVRRQTYRNVEILVVDDGSRDGTVERIRMLQQEDPRIRLFCLEHRGVSGVRNFGLDQAQGDYIAFLDGDDAWRPDFLSTMVDALEGADFAVSGQEFPESVARRDALSRELAPPGDKKLYSSRAYLSGMLREELSERISDKLYRAEALAGHRFPEELCHNEDKYFLYQVLVRIHKVTVLQQKLSIYLQRDGSLSHSAYVPDNYLAAQWLLEKPGLEDEAHIQELRRHYRLMLLLNMRLLVRSRLTEKSKEYDRLQQLLLAAPKAPMGGALGLEERVARLGFVPYAAFVRGADWALKHLRRRKTP